MRTWLSDFLFIALPVFGNWGLLDFCSFFLCVFLRVASIWGAVWEHQKAYETTARERRSLGAGRGVAGERAGAG